MTDHPAFEIHKGDHVWRIYADGRVEGFPEGSIIVNGIAALIHQAHHEGCKRGAIEGPEICNRWPCVKNPVVNGKCVNGHSSPRTRGDSHGRDN